MRDDVVIHSGYVVPVTLEVIGDIHCIQDGMPWVTLPDDCPCWYCSQKRAA